MIEIVLSKFAVASLGVYGQNRPEEATKEDIRVIERTLFWTYQKDSDAQKPYTSVFLHRESRRKTVTTSPEEHNSDVWINGESSMIRSLPRNVKSSNKRGQESD